MTVLELQDVHVTHGAGTPWAVPALHAVNLRLESGDRLLVVGGNGSGKSTLLSVLGGLIVPTSGTCLLDGEPVSDRSDLVSIVIQNTRLQLMRPTVSEELDDFASSSAELPRVVNTLGLATLLNRRIDELSGGQQRRVGIASALLRKSQLLLLDEPMAGLDAESARGLLDALRLVAPTTIVVVVTHDLDATRALVDGADARGNGRVITLDRGRVEERQRS